MHLFMPLTKDEVRERVEARWDLSGFFPRPRWDVLCPCCRSDEVHLRSVRFSQRSPDAKSPHSRRCDVFYKCTCCSLVFHFGIPIPERMWEEKQGDQRYRRKDNYHWREMIAALEDQGELREDDIRRPTGDSPQSEGTLEAIAGRG